MHKQYLYPENLRSQPTLWLWSLRDIAILAIALVISVLAITQTGAAVPLAITLCYGFLTIRHDDSTVLDFIRRGVKYFITNQQYYEWQESDIGSHGGDKN